MFTEILLSLRLASHFQESTTLSDEEMTHMRLEVVGLPYDYDGIYIKRGTGALEIHLIFEEADVHSAFTARRKHDRYLMI